MWKNNQIKHSLIITRNNSKFLKPLDFVKHEKRGAAFLLGSNQLAGHYFASIKEHRIIRREKEEKELVY